MTMRVKQDGLHFCSDCACCAANDDTSGCSDERAEKVRNAVRAFGPHLVSSDAAPWEECYTCDCCGDVSTGEGHFFSVLEPKPLTKKQVRECINRMYWALSRLVDKQASKCARTRVQDLFRDLQEVCDKGEKEHMSFGRRMLGHTPPRKQPHLVRVYYFVVKTILSDTKITSPEDAVSLRRDYVIGAAIRDALQVSLGGQPGETSHIQAHMWLTHSGQPDMATFSLFQQIDYSKDLA